MAYVFVATEDKRALNLYLADIDSTRITSFFELINLMRLYLIAGDSRRAAITLSRIKSSPDYVSENLFNPSDVYAEYSAALYCAATDIIAGNRSEGEKLADDVLGMLARLERNGMNWHGLYSLRAQALALRGDADGAMASLTQAVKLGWRSSWIAEREPYLLSLVDRADFRTLIDGVKKENARMRTRIANGGERRL